MKKQAKRQERLAVLKKKPNLSGAFNFILSKFNKECLSQGRMKTCAKARKLYEVYSLRIMAVNTFGVEICPSGHT
jgi:hypothetical protein